MTASCRAAKRSLRRLPGIGPYTAAAIACIAFEETTVPVDGNVERVLARLYRVEDALPRAKPAIRASLPKALRQRPARGISRKR